MTAAVASIRDERRRDNARGTSENAGEKDIGREAAKAATRPGAGWDGNGRVGTEREMLSVRERPLCGCALKCI